MSCWQCCCMCCIWPSACMSKLTYLEICGQNLQSRYLCQACTRKGANSRLIVISIADSQQLTVLPASVHAAYIPIDVALASCCCPCCWQRRGCKPCKYNTNAASVFMKHLHIVETRLFCPQALLSLDFECRNDVSQLR